MSSHQQVQKYQRKLDELSEAHNRLRSIRQLELSSDADTPDSVQATDLECHQIIQRLTAELRGEDILDDWEMLTPKALRLGLQLH